MAAASTDFKRLFVQGLKWDSEDLTADGTPTSFYDALKTASRARLTDTKAGRVLIGTAANGRSSTFALPLNGRDLTPTAIAELCGEILRRYDEAKALLVAAGNAAPTDDQIYAELLALLVDVTDCTGDFSTLSYR